MTPSQTIFLIEEIQLNIDNFLEIGASHKICEDYIISGDDPVPYIILSDGCSTANNSEMGSRILCHLAKQYLKYRQDDLDNIDYWKLGTWVIHNAELIARQLGLSSSCLTATLTVAYYIDNQIRIMMYGDGSIITVDTDGTIHVTSVEYKNNSPYYLVYLIDQGRGDMYQKNNPTKYINYIHGDTEPYIVDQLYKTPTDIKIPMEFLTLITSDGIDSFLKKEGNSTQYLNSKEIIPLCIAFKSTKGKFLKRRLNKQMLEFTKANISHFDDLSIGAFLD